MDIKKNTLYQLLNLGFAGVSMLFFTIVIARIVYWAPRHLGFIVMCLPMQGYLEYFMTLG